MSEIGTLAWARRTGGRLTRRERLSQARGLVIEQLGLLPRPWRRRLETDPRVTLPSEEPSSEIARAAYEYAEGISPPFLVAHCMRTWLFGELAAAARGLEHDRELFYVAAMLHDIGLVDAHNGRDPRAHCFAVEGGFATEEFLTGRGWQAERAEAAAEAVILHLNPSVPPERHGAEAHLLNVATAIDVVGRGLHELPRAEVRKVAERYPRAGFATGGLARFRAQAKARPEARAALLWRMGFALFVRRNPLETRESAAPATTHVSRTS